MIENIESSDPVAQKEYRCMFCDGIIHIREKHHSETNSVCGFIEHWRSHSCCYELTSFMDDYENDEGGIDDIGFKEWVNNYVHENHYDDKLDDIDIEWQNMSYQEKAKRIYEELRNQGKIITPQDRLLEMSDALRRIFG